MPQMKVRCMVCKKFLGWKPCSKQMEGKTSHGLCEKHYAEKMKEIENMGSGEKKDNED